MLAVEMRGITKRFHGLIANDNVNFLVEKGEIHSLLGENGAGKTTLMKVLFGLYKCEEGTVNINGKPSNISSPRDAYKLGIGMVHQHFMLVNNLTVLENIILGNEPGNIVIDKKAARKAVQELSDKYNFDLDLDAKISDLPVGLKQRVEIMKTLYCGADIIILDEPTAVLTPIEVTQLLTILKDMKAKGKTIIFITHKLNETMEISDHVTILRGGKSVAFIETKNTSPKDLASLMVGEDVNFEIIKQAKEPGESVLSIKNVRLLDNAESTINFDIKAGEIFGIAGVEGNGQQQLEELIIGIQKCNEGSIELNGKDITNLSVRERQKNGIGYIPSDRFKQGILPKFSLVENLLLGNQFSNKYTKYGIIDFSTLIKDTKNIMKSYDVRAVDEKQKIGSLSGGNQQKLVLGREVEKNADLIIACQPVRGLDIGAIKYIHEILLELRQQGKAVLLISAELSDLFQLSDRIGVLYKGVLTAVKKSEDYTNESISLLMAGRQE